MSHVGSVEGRRVAAFLVNSRALSDKLPAPPETTTMRLGFLALVLASITIADGAPPGGYRAGDKVEILFGGKWYPGTVLEAGEGKWKVHYDGYADSWDTWLGADKLRPAGGGGAEPAPPGGGAELETGEMAEASWNNSWYEVKILAIDGNRVQVRWWETAQVEWIERERIRRKGEFKEILPRKGREGNGGGLPAVKMVGREVEVFWNGKWYPARVEKAEGNRLSIRYVGFESSAATQSEWVSLPRVREVGGAARIRIRPEDVPGAKGLDGLWYRYLSIAPGSLIRQYFLFFPDGRLFRAFPRGGVEKFDFDAVQKADPDHCGAYGVLDGRLHIVMGGDADDVSPMEMEPLSEGQMKLNGIRTFRAVPFAARTRLVGTWVAEGSGAAGAGQIGFRKTWLFRADGTFEYRFGKSIGAAGGDGTASAEQIQRGTYELSGFTLLKTHEDGRKDPDTIFLFHDSGANFEAICLSDERFLRRE